jgi:hypothetical protein
MDVLVAAVVMDSEETLRTTAPDMPIATATAPMETTSPAGLKRAATGGREAKTKVPKKVLSKEDKGVQTAKRWGQHRNLKEMNAAEVATQ